MLQIILAQKQIFLSDLKANISEAIRNRKKMYFIQGVSDFWSLILKS